MDRARMARMVVIFPFLIAGTAGAQAVDSTGPPRTPVLDKKSMDQTKANRRIWKPSQRAADQRTKDPEVHQANGKVKGLLSRVRDSLTPPSAKVNGLVRDGWAAFHRREFDRAEAVLDEAIGIDPWCAEAHRARGLARHNRYKWSEAIADYEETIRLEPDEWHTYFYRASALRFGRDAWAALDAFSEAIERFPEVAHFHASRAEVRLALRDARAAREDAEQALRLDPDHQKAMEFWMEALDKSGADATFKLALDSQVELWRWDPRPYARRAFLLATSPDPRVRNPKAALDDALRAESLSRGRSRAALRAKAAAQAALGDYPLAICSAVRAMFTELPNRDAGTDLIQIATFLVRRPLIKRPWPGEPPKRGVPRLQIGLGRSEQIGTYLTVDGGRALFLRAALLRDLPFPLVIVSWNPRGVREILDTLRGKTPSAMPAARRTQ
jgi:tetratricopeptide (TPR) repeat protein